LFSFIGVIQVVLYPECTLIISVYKDVESLCLILDKLAGQSSGNIGEIIISEDGESIEMAQFIKSVEHKWTNLKHLTQGDSGFRKNKALNRAILSTSNDYLIFIDGDCIPHTHFIRSHLQNSAPGTVCVGRRTELGKGLSVFLKRFPGILKLLENKLVYFLFLLPMLLDGIKNAENGIYSPLLNRLSKKGNVRILGCNFSCFKKDLVSINGFNEDYQEAGTGEDTDIDWRLKQAGVKSRNIKFLAIEYHLYHKKGHAYSIANNRILDETIAENRVVCTNGLYKEMK